LNNIINYIAYCQKVNSTMIGNCNNCISAKPSNDKEIRCQDTGQLKGKEDYCKNFKDENNVIRRS